MTQTRAPTPAGSDRYELTALGRSVSNPPPEARPMKAPWTGPFTAAPRGRGEWWGVRGADGMIEDFELLDEAQAEYLAAALNCYENALADDAAERRWQIRRDVAEQP